MVAHRKNLAIGKRRQEPVKTNAVETGEYQRVRHCDGTCVATGTTRNAGMSNVSYPIAARRLAVSWLNGAVRVTHTRPASGGMLKHVANAAPIAVDAVCEKADRDIVP